MNMAMRRLNQRQEKSKEIFYYDRFCLAAVVGLILIGLLMVASSSIVIADKQYHQSFYFLMRQASYLALGFILALITLRIDINTWHRYSSVLLIGTLALLVLVLIPGIGHTVNGSRRWINLGFMRVQVSEIAKLVMMMFMASYIVRRSDQIQNEFIGFIKPLLVLAVFAVLLLKEPDFGAVVVMGISTILLLFLAKVRVSHFMILVLVVGLLFAAVAVTSPYRLARLTSFIDPWSRQFDSGYQLTQSLIAFGRGGWFGVGLGLSIQKLFYLPEAHNDFLFAILAEEFGLLGTLTVISLYSLLIIRGLIIARRALAQNLIYGGYLAYGITFLLGLQALVNIGVNSGVLPTKGLTLPFMSYGGSSMAINCVAIALLLRIDYETRRLKFPLVP